LTSVDVSTPDDGRTSPACALETLLEWRRDVRHFQRRPVPEAEMEQLFALTRFAPSVGNAQPWRFVRVRNPDLRVALARHVDETAMEAGQAYEGECQALYNALKLHGVREAPEIVAVYSDERPSAGHGLGIRTMPEALRYSTVLAIHTLWLAASSRGIGLGWISILEAAVVNQLLCTPPEWHFVALLCIGYPEEPSDRPELDRRGWQARECWQDRVSER
jgi:5,6-dimethylbenzimidazole synthase